jgi:hypothetical protein
MRVVGINNGWKREKIYERKYLISGVAATEIDPF